MTKFLFVPLSLIVCSCASTKPAPVFHATSLAPVKQAVEKTASHVKSAQGAAARLDAECKEKSANWAAAWDDLKNELDAAYVSAQIANESVDAKQLEVNTANDAANKVANDYNKLLPQVDAVKASRHGWVKRFWIAAVAAAGMAAWTFRKPLMLLGSL